MSSITRKLTIKNLLNNEESSTSNILETARDFEKIDISKYFGPLVSEKFYINFPLSMLSF